MTRFKSLSLLLIITILVGAIPTSFSRAQLIAPAPVIDVAGNTLIKGTNVLVGATNTQLGKINTTLLLSAKEELAGKTAQTAALAVKLDNQLDLVPLKAIDKTAKGACEGIDKSEEIASTADTVGDFSVIGGGPAQAAKLTAKINALRAVKLCRETQLESVDALVPTSVTGSEAYAMRQNELATEISALDTRIESLKEQQTAEVKGVLKAIMVRIILNLSKSLTTEVVNKMVEKYKISDYLAYGDALATQVYSMKYINENYSGDARQQMMLRSILQLDKFPEKINTVRNMANSKANEYLGQACDVATGTTSQDQNYFMKCLAAYGSPQANPTYQVLQAYDEAQAANAAGRSSANAELSQSNGFAPPRNCEGTVSAQTSIDQQFDAAAVAEADAVRTASILRQALKTTPPTTTQAEYDQAQAVADQAIANRKALEAQTDSPIVDICKAIDSPASFVSDSIATFLEKHLVSDTDLKTDNLPFYAGFLADVTSNFLTNILTGGKANSQVLKETGVKALNGALMGVTQGTTVISPPITGNVEIYARQGNNPAKINTLVAGQPYILEVSFRNLTTTGSDGKKSPFKPYSVVISGASDESDSDIVLSAAELAAGNVSFDFTPAKAGEFTLKVQFYDKATSQAKPAGATSWAQRFTVSGTVNGAVTSIPSASAVVLPRGPQVSIR